MKSAIKILMLEDSSTDAMIIQQLLTKEITNCEFKLAMDEKSFLQALDDFSPEVILSDHSLPKYNASDALKTVRQKLPNTPFIMVTGAVSEEYAADIIKKGADDYILKDRMFRLPSAIRTALDQRRALKELNDYKYALDQSAIVSITDHKGTILYANENFCILSKYSAQELIGENHRIIKSGYHNSEFIKTLWTTIDNGQIWKGEFCNKAKDGSIFWVGTTIIPFLDEQNKPYQYLAIQIDITEKKYAEDALKFNEMRLREAQSIAQIGNWEVDLVNNTHIWSDELYHIFGLNQNEVDASVELFVSFIHPNDIDKAKSIIADAFEHFTDSTIKFRFVKQDGKTRFANIEWKFGFNESGLPTRVFGVLQDITERKEAEENLKWLEQKILEQTIHEQKKITRAIVQTQEKERNFIGQELHDNINQILAGTKLYLAMAGKKSEEIQQSISYPLVLIDKAIDEIRLLSKKLASPLKSFHLKELITDLLSIIKADSTVNTFFKYNVPDEAISVDLKLNIYRIIQEQINNIQKYSGANNVNVYIIAIDNSIKITITDDGNGFDLSIKRKGIGISNIINRVESFNGIIELHSSPGNGCKLDLSIPIESI